MTSFFETAHSRWLDAHVDNSAKITTFTQCLTLAKNEKDGARLIVADFRLNRDDLPANSKPKLKFYSGISLMAEQTLPGIPSGVASFYLDKIHPLTPGIAVTCTSDILVFRNNKPYYKFSIPSLPVDNTEEEIWRSLADPVHSEDLKRSVDRLLSIPQNILTPRSLKLLSTPEDEMRNFIQIYKNKPLEKHNVITCMTTILKKENNPDSISWLVLGTEVGDLYIIDTQGFTVAHQGRVNSVKSTPVELCCTGQFEVDFRCFIACRENFVCVLRRGWLEGQILFHINGRGTIVSMIVIPGELNIVLGLSNSDYVCYSKKGRQIWSIELPSPILTMTSIPLQHLNLTLIAVAIRGGSVRIYKGRDHVDTILTSKDISALKFGPLGQEENTLVMIATDGTLIIKILKRTADFNIEMLQETITAPQEKNLKIPKKTKLFVEQANRERQNALEMHKKFQQEYLRMQLEVAQTLIKTLDTAENSTVPLRLSAEVMGLGPKYTLTVFVENMSADEVFFELALLFHASVAHYKISKPHIKLPAIINGGTYQFDTQVTEVMTENNNESDVTALRQMQILAGPPIKAFIIKHNQVQPLLAATIHMPVSEPF